MKVLVTGGTGLVGSALKEFKPEWIYISSKDCDLSDYSKVKQLLSEQRPDVIIHLAANVGGLFKNASHRLEMFNSNLIMNYNLLENAYNAGIRRVICCLSTCIFPDGLNRSLTEKDLHLGEPHHSNYGYAYAKRIMEVQCRLYNETPGFTYQCIIPTNIYGPHDNFHLQNSHVIPGLIHKSYVSQLTAESVMRIMGTGLPKRQFIFSNDLARIIIRLIDEQKYEPILICSTPENEETTILHVAKLIANEFGIEQVIPSEQTVGENDGQQIKTANPARLLELFPDFSFTPLTYGIQQTVDWFKRSYPNIRK
jgi:GDP-L-fucose synthase